MSPQGVVREIQSGAQCFIIFARVEVEERERPSIIPVVHEFEDVFLDEVPGLLMSSNFCPHLIFKFGDLIEFSVLKD